MSRAALIERLAQQMARAEGAGFRGLMRPGKPPLLERIGFLLGSANNDRLYDIGRYLDTRRAGGRTPAGAPRTGRYTGAYSGAGNEPVPHAAAADGDDWVAAYRGLERPFDGEFRPNPNNWYGNTVSVSRSPDAASFYARKTTGSTFGEGANVMPVQVRGPFASSNEFSALVSRHMGSGRWTKKKEVAAVQRATEELRRRGFNGVESSVDSEIAIFADPNGRVSNVRSATAAHEAGAQGGGRAGTAAENTTEADRLREALRGLAIALPVGGGLTLREALRQRANEAI